MYAIVLYISFFFAVSADFDIFRGFLDVEVAFYLSTSLVMIYSLRSFVTIDCEKYFHCMGNKVKSKTPFDDKIILFFSERFLTSIEDEIYDTSIRLSEVIELDYRYPPFECHISHESTG